MSFESISSSIGNTLSTPLSQNTALWIIVAGVIGRIITQVLKFVFEHSVPEWQRRRVTRIAIQKYSPSIYQSAITVWLTIRRILKESTNPVDADEKLSVLYNFGCLLGWIQIFINESFSEDIGIAAKRKYFGMVKFRYYISELLQGISIDYALTNKNWFPRIVRDNVIPTYALNAIGELKHLPLHLF
ncbi:MAG: hypothetical protein WA941_20205 [Nitrososphaeraceae archaeon]